MSDTLRTNRRGETDHVLLIDDDEVAVRHARTAFDAATNAQLLVAQDREEALARLLGEGEHEGTTLPDLVLLDLELEGRTGYDLLETIRNEPGLAALPVIVLTDSAGRDDVARSYEAKANAFVPKPDDEETFIDTMAAIDRFWLRQVKLPPLSR